MKSTVASQRALDNAAADAEGKVREQVGLSCRDAVHFATVEGARANGLDHLTGTLEVGKEADVIVLKTDTPAMFPVNNPWGSLVYAAHPGTVDSVFVQGKPVKRDGQLVGVDMDRLKRLAYESRDYLFDQAEKDETLPDAELGGNWVPEPVVGPEDE